MNLNDGDCKNKISFFVHLDAVIEVLPITHKLSETYGRARVYNPAVEGLGERLREIRKRAGKEQMDIARAVLGGEATVKKLKSFANRISQIERGRGGNPSLQFLEQIATGLGLTISGLFLQIEGLPAGAQPASITDTPKPIEAAGAPIPADDSAFAARMVSLCLTAAELSDRDATRAGLEELAVAFAMAAPAGLAQETKNKVKSRRPPRRQAS